MLLHVHVHDYGAGGGYGDAALAREGYDSEQQGALKKEIAQRNIVKRWDLRKGAAFSHRICSLALDGGQHLQELLVEQ